MLSQYELETLRDIPIHRLLGLTNSGNRVKLLCPFHKEKTASFFLNSDNSFKCFGCGKGGRGAIDFVVELGYTFQEALEELVKEL